MLKLWYANPIDYYEDILNDKDYGKWKNQGTSHLELQGGHKVWIHRQMNIGNDLLTLHYNM